METSGVNPYTMRFVITLFGYFVSSQMELDHQLYLQVCYLHLIVNPY